MTVAISENEKVRYWRELQMLRAGATEALALLVAERPDINLHVAVSLLERGADSEMVQKIID